MTLDVPAFVHDFSPAAVHYGRGCVSNLADTMAAHDLERAVVVTGTNVGANRAVMDPVEAGLGDRLAGVGEVKVGQHRRLRVQVEAVELAGRRHAEFDRRRLRVALAGLFEEDVDQSAGRVHHAERFGLGGQIPADSVLSPPNAPVPS
jgi:hypothetical protein